LGARLTVTPRVSERIGGRTQTHADNYGGAPRSTAEADLDVVCPSRTARFPPELGVMCAGVGRKTAIRAGLKLAWRLETIICAWDQRPVSKRPADASRLRSLVEEASTPRTRVAIVSDIDVDSVDGQLGARPDGPGAS
jgi:hypothetical protein